MTSRTRSHARVLKIGAVYLDSYHRVLVTVEDHEIVDGRRTGRVIVCGADGVERFPRRWYAREQDLVDPPAAVLAARSGAET